MRTCPGYVHIMADMCAAYSRVPHLILDRRTRSRAPVWLQLQWGHMLGAWCLQLQARIVFVY